MNNDEESPIALITGGEGDLAKAITAALVADGFHVLAPGRGELDVCSPESVSSFFQANFSKPPRLDLLVNNAGVTLDRPFLKMGEGDWDDVLETNLNGAQRCAKPAFQMMMKQRRGHIINVGSFSGVCPPAGQANYAAAKAGLIGLSQSLAAEGGKRNIRVNCVLPGFLETKMTAGLSEAVIESAKEKHQLGKFNTVADAGRFIAFLHTMNGVSGQVFQLDSRLRRWT